jgi:hypothetical protein
MTHPVYMNGTDYMMSVFDRHLKSMGFSGNLSHLVLGLSLPPDHAALRGRLQDAARAFPMLSARPKRGTFTLLPYWELPAAGVCRTPVLRTVKARPADGETVEALRARILNEPLDDGAGEWVRLTLVEGEGRAELVMTWAHVLMDARGAEILLSWLGNAGPGLPPSGAAEAEKTLTRRAFPSEGLWKDLRLAWKALRWLDHIGTPPPLSLYMARSPRAQPRQTARYLSFSSDETARVRESSSRLCGFLGETTYYLAAVLVELNALCVAGRIPAESYIVNLPANARDKGSREPIFSNLSSFITHYLRRNQVTDMSTAIAALQDQTRESLGLRLGAAFDSFGTQVRRIPPKPYWDRMKLALNGEIASLFFANTGTSPDLDRFMEQEVAYLHHVTSVTCPPGLGVFFHTFKSRLCCTIALVEGLLTADEEATFAASLRERLLNPGSSSGSAP